ncbi:MAG: helix-turn-helix transcriptional regulator [Cyanothece sp. SIO2G6]|nr:helix-turn-helix transcriptional regulator [Cyanothece sp. SIO2G6]
MRVKFSATDIDELYAQWSQQPGVLLQEDSSETLLKLPPRMGHGWLQRVQLRPGLEVALRDIEFPEPFVAEVSESLDWNFVEFTSSLSGHAKAVTKGTQDEYYITPKQSRVSFFKDYSGWTECQSRQPMLNVEINVTVPVLNALISGHPTQLSPALSDVLEGTSTRTFSHSQTMDRVVLQAAEQILNCPYQGLTRRLYLESRAIELIALQLSIGHFDPTNAPVYRPLKANDVDCIYHARDVLLKDIENPPSLGALAQQVKLNDYKLKQGFRQVFGTTVFGYLYHYRMERAKYLLETSHLTVTEVAQAVGYESATSFSAAFKKRFGGPPKNYKGLSKSAVSHNRRLQ